MISIKRINLEKKIIILREDFNIPVLNNKIINLNKLLLCIPNLKFLLKKKAKIIVISHFKNPSKNFFCKKYSLFKICKILSIILKKNIIFLSNVKYKDINIKSGQIALIENIRFEKQEKTCGIKISKKISYFKDIFLINAFASSHRIHASIYGITKFIKKKYIGILLEKELNINKYILISVT